MPLNKAEHQQAIESNHRFNKIFDILSHTDGQDQQFTTRTLIAHKWKTNGYSDDDLRRVQAIVEAVSAYTSSSPAEKGILKGFGQLSSKMYCSPYLLELLTTVFIPSAVRAGIDKTWPTRDPLLLVADNKSPERGGLFLPFRAYQLESRLWAIADTTRSFEARIEPYMKKMSQGHGLVDGLSWKESDEYDELFELQTRVGSKFSYWGMAFNKHILGQWNKSIEQHYPGVVKN